MPQQVISGTAKNIPPNNKLYVVVYSKSARKYFPSETAVSIQPDGKWVVHLAIGASTDQGKAFTIIALLMEEKDCNRFEFVMKRPDFSGFEYLPEVSKIYDSIDVYRK
ncbi:MAG: hypothetical protein R3F48_09995 [Candidatus Zixiibacteriota bacterium]